VRLPLKPFILVGATTQTGLLSAPLRDRFGFQAKLDLYDEAALAAIVARSAELGFVEHRLATIADRHGRPMYLVSQFRPAP
jgi:Holliday junction resolvasome RuvABC ATP-dependent DNA helicase subunit